MNVLITGSTGMVGEGVLHACLDHPDVSAITLVNRRPGGVSHAKLTEILLPDFSDFTSIRDQLKGFDSALLCMGVSSAGMKEEQYFHLTYDLTMALAVELRALNPGMTLCYVSGLGTDSTEQGRIMWARVKGRTENELLDMGFPQAFMFRPGFIVPGKAMQNTQRSYKFLKPFVPMIKWMAPNYICELEMIGQAMLEAAFNGYEKSIIEVSDIKTLAEKSKTRGLPNVKK